MDAICRRDGRHICVRGLFPRIETQPDVITLAELEAKLPDGAFIQMDRSDYPDTYQRLGGEAFARANELAKWPAVTVAASKRCDKVGVAYISDQATSERLVWFVDCENRERFWITEVEAVATRDNFDDDGVAQIDIPASAPASAAFDDMSEADVIARCDTAVKSALKSQSSFDPSSRLQFMKHQHNGRVTAIHDFEAQKAFGATLSSRYVCLVDVASMELVEVRIRESGDWKHSIS